MAFKEIFELIFSMEWYEMLTLIGGFIVVAPFVKWYKRAKKEEEEELAKESNNRPIKKNTWFP